jgi:ATP synthase protein I
MMMTDRGKNAADRSAGTDPADADLKTTGDRLELESDGEVFKPLTREEAEKLGVSRVLISPWALVASQLAAGIVLALVAWALTGQARMGWSTGYGALAVVIPSALFVRGFSRQKNVTHGGTALVGFFVWEMIKIALTIAMLVAAPRLVIELSWLALLAGFVLTMKVYWVAVWFRLLRRKSVK